MHQELSMSVLGDPCLGAHVNPTCLWESQEEKSRSGGESQVGGALAIFPICLAHSFHCCFTNFPISPYFPLSLFSILPNSSISPSFTFFFPFLPKQSFLPMQSFFLCNIFSLIDHFSS